MTGFRIKVLTELIDRNAMKFGQKPLERGACRVRVMAPDVQLDTIARRDDRRFLMGG
jgi:hypothetical protein